MEYNPAITPLDAWITAKIDLMTEEPLTDKLARYQLARLNETIAWAKSRSPFYRRLYATNRLRPLVSLAELASYPLISAQEVAEHGMQMLCVSQSHVERIVTLQTSGTTGTPKRIFFTKDDQNETSAFFSCGVSTFAKEGQKAMIFLPSDKPGSVGALLQKGLPQIGVRPILYGLVDEAADAVQALEREQTGILIGIPVQILAMAYYWENSQTVQWKPSAVLLSTDYVPVAVAETLRCIWGCRVYAHYGMTEMGLGGGIECDAHDGYHLRETDLYFEIVDSVSGAVMPDGEYGEVVFTTLTRRGMPLIRYRTGDISRMITEPCLCGSQLRRLETIRTRKNTAVSLASGSLTMADLDEVLFRLPQVIDFTAALSGRERKRLKLALLVAPGAQLPEAAAVLQAVRTLSVIKEAEKRGNLILQLAFRFGWRIKPGKRRIYETEGAEMGQNYDEPY